MYDTFQLLLAGLMGAGRQHNKSVCGHSQYTAKDGIQICHNTNFCTCEPGEEGCHRPGNLSAVKGME